MSTSPIGHSESDEEQARRLRIELIKAKAGKVHFDGDLEGNEKVRA